MNKIICALFGHRYSQITDPEKDTHICPFSYYDKCTRCGHVELNINCDHPTCTGKIEWRKYRKQYKHIVFLCRERVDNGDVEVKLNGPLGNGDWVPLNRAFAHRWEHEWFDNAELIKE